MGADTVSHRGRIEKGEDPDTIEGVLRCVITGWEIKIRGTRRGAGYDVECTLGPVPDPAFVAYLDGERE